ncbi:MAG: LLM class F420-dependent oxidoreductase [Actinobacteria bacterium 13_2_20CM_2_72_6]|nr:MAG: LLM class F420-dependent oxidoreductase [Actinobacteria bacterium 13_2_20CM_2_72_6]
MRVSLSVTDYSWADGPTAGLARIARAADAAGLDTLWVADHLIQVAPGSPPDGNMLEAYTALAWLAARTERIRLGAMVSAVTYRPPALLVKAVTTLDVLSGGRAWFGAGAGYHEEEARLMGLPLPPVAERFDRLDETLRTAKRMWSDPAVNPPPVRRPHPPILVGGTGERRTLRLVAEYADACNLFDIPDGGVTVRHKLAVLAEHCTEVGRPYDAIEKTLSTRLDAGESPESFVARCTGSAALGIEHVVVITNGPWTDDAVACLAAAVPQLAGKEPHQ